MPVADLGTPGVGAWVVPPGYSRRMTIPSDSWQRQRVRYAVIAIQHILIARGYLGTVNSLDGGFGPKTDIAVRKFQHDAGTRTDGIVGRVTARRLFLTQFIWWQAALQIPDHLLYGMAFLESGFDPGAEGAVDHNDRGVMQYNRVAHPEISDLTAFSDVAWCVQNSAHELRAAFDDLGDWNAAVAWHNNPSKARAWAESGLPPDDQIAQYVKLVRRQAAVAP